MRIYLNSELRITYTTYTHMCTFQGAFCDLAEFCTHCTTNFLYIFCLLPKGFKKIWLA